MYRSLFLLLLLLGGLTTVQAKRAASVSSMDELWTFFVAVNTCVFLPVLLYFLVMLARDPASQELLTLVWAYAKQKTMGFLSPVASNITKQRRPLVAQQPKPKPTATSSRRKRQAF